MPPLSGGSLHTGWVGAKMPKVSFHNRLLSQKFPGGPCQHSLSPPFPFLSPFPSWP